MTYLVAERFKSVQGEGVWTGTPMAFIRFVGCSVGKKVCHACDTTFERELPWQGGGTYTTEDLAAWVGDFRHVCLTGGEPLNQDLEDLVEALVVRPYRGWERVIHIETSGTEPIPDSLQHCWICVSPKPGFLETVVMQANEVKVIVPGLGSGDGWPTIDDALAWAETRTVFLQPRNGREAIDAANLALCEALVLEHPQLRLSVQLHKMLRVR